MDPRLLVGVALTLATGALLAYVGFLVSRKHATGEAQVALRAFSTWWFSVSLVILLSGSHTLLGLVGVTDLALHVALGYLTQIPLAVALCALLYYLIYLYTGKRAALRALCVAYALFLAFAFYYMAAQGPRTLQETEWNIRLVGPGPPQWLNVAFGVLLLAPVLFIVAAYGLLLRRVDEPEQKFRLGLTSLAFLLWFSPVLVGFLLGWQSAPWFALVYQAPGVLASALIVLAHRPPPSVRARLQGAAKA